jgi:RING/U-box domain-containing protein
MGLYNSFPSPGEGVLPLLVMNTILSVALLKNMVRSVLQIVSFAPATPNSEQDQSSNEGNQRIRRRVVSVTKFESLCKNRGFAGYGGNGGSVRWSSLECCCCCCCVCLSGFEADEEVSELGSCKHFFHKGCLDKWFDDYQRTTCPLCRSLCFEF